MSAPGGHIGFGLGVISGAVSVLLVWFVAVVYVDVGLRGLTNEILTKLVPPLFGAFAGAMAAFYFSVRKDRDEVNRTQISAGNFVIFRLHEMYSKLANFQKHFIEPLRADSARWIKMDNPAPGMVLPVEIQFQELSWLLGHPSKDNPGGQVLSDLLEITEHFRVAVQIIDIRARMFVEEVYASRTNLPGGRSVNVPGATALEQIMGFANPSLRPRLIALTDTMVTRVDETINEIQALYPKVRDAILFVHPAANLIELKFPER